MVAADKEGWLVAVTPSGGWVPAVIAGPVLGGLLYLAGPGTVYLASAALLHRWMLAFLGHWKEVLFPGFVCVILGAAGIAVGWKARGRERELTVLYAGLGVVALWASFGPAAGLYRILFATVPGFELMRHDVTFPLYVEVDQIYNLACPASPVHYQHDPVQTTKTSVHGAINMLGLAKRVGAKIFQASTSEVYGDPSVHPQPEDYWGNVNPIGPRSCYDEGKRCAETLFFDYWRQHRLEIKVARIFNTYGPRMHPNDGRVVSNFIVQALAGRPLTVYGDGRQTRSFCFVDDLVRVGLPRGDVRREKGRARAVGPGGHSGRNGGCPGPSRASGRSAGVHGARALCGDCGAVDLGPRHRPLHVRRLPAGQVGCAPHCVRSAES